MRSLVLFLSALPLLALPLSIAAGEEAAAKPAKPAQRTFDKDVLPILRAKCLRCHAGVEPEAGLNLSLPATLLIGGDSGPALRIGAAESSLLYEMIAGDTMPLKGPKLSAEEKGIIRTWINEGAVGVDPASALGGADEHEQAVVWSFEPPVRPPVPFPEHPASREMVNPIDAFVLQRLATRKLSWAPRGDRLTLLRRASFDLLGLPPSPSQIERFLADTRPDADARMIDRLLADPHYGERWGRHWLDVAGYADSAGILFEDRPLPLLWRYRDYVIRALNEDKPYDRFLQEQIAGDELHEYWSAYETADELPAEVVEGLTATGYLRTAADPSRPDFTSIKNARGQYYYPTLFDTLQIVCSSTMGLTVQCARCHSHKYDPIPQTDYYRMQAIFMSAYRVDKWIPQMNRRLKVATKRQQEAADKSNQEMEARVKKLQASLAAIRDEFTEPLFAKRLAALDESVRDEVAAAFAEPEATRNESQKALVKKHQAHLRPAGDALEKALAETFDEYKAKREPLQKEVAAEQARRAVFDEIRAIYDLPGETKTHLLLRGDPLTPGPQVQPGVISTLQTPQPFQWEPPSPEARTSGRRLAFAKWLTQPQHPLTARVMVNRIWMHHFGKGIVATPEDFGVSGAPPSHPLLLDWLATEFVESGWSIKHIHRLILSSRTWQQRSQVDVAVGEAARQVDPENRLLWRQSLRRLEAEPLRDAVLACSGLLRDQQHGPPLAARRLPSGEVVVGAETGPSRRSIYGQILRLNRATMLAAFDQPEIAVNCTRRSASTVSTQALTLLNSDFMVAAADAFARRVLAEAPEDPGSHALQIAFGRVPSESERAELQAFLEAQTAVQLAGGAATQTAAKDAAKDTAKTAESQTAAKTESDAQRAAARQRAVADLCHMLLSANEFTYID